MHVYQITYRLCGKTLQAVRPAKDEMTAWLMVFRSHYLGSELIEILEITP